MGGAMNPIQSQPTLLEALIAELEEQVSLSKVATDDSLGTLEAWRSKAQKGSEQREAKSKELNGKLNKILEDSRVALDHAQIQLQSISGEMKPIHNNNLSELRNAEDSIEVIEIVPKTLDVKSVRGEVRRTSNEMQNRIRKAQELSEKLVALEKKTGEYREHWDQKIAALHILIFGKVDTFQESTEAFAERSKNFKALMKSARKLCLDA